MMKKLGLVIAALVLLSNTALDGEAKKAGGKKAGVGKKGGQLVGFDTISCKKIVVQDDSSITVCVEGSKPGLGLDREISYQVQKAAQVLAKTSRGKGIKKVTVGDTSGRNFSCTSGAPDPCEGNTWDPMCPGYMPPADPCEGNTWDPMCPGYDPCVADPMMMGCPGYMPPADPCEGNTWDPMCPGYDPCAADPMMMGCPAYDPCYMNTSDPMCPGYIDPYGL